MVKTQGNLLGKKGYVFEPNKRFYITKIDEKNKKIHFTVGGKKKEEPVEVIESASENTAVRRLQEVIDANNDEFFRRSINQRGQQSAKRFDELPDRDLPQVGTAKTEAGDVNEYMMRQYEEAVDNLETAKLMETQMREGLVASQNTKTAIRKYAQQRVQQHRLYASQMVQDGGSNVLTALVKNSDRNAFDPRTPLISCH